MLGSRLGCSGALEGLKYSTVLRMTKFVKVLDNLIGFF